MPRILKKIISFLICFAFLLEQSCFAQVPLQLNFAVNSPQINQSQPFRPLHLRYLNYEQATGNLNVLLDKGSGPAQSRAYEPKAADLMKLFLTGVSLPESVFWVNLRPDNPEGVIAPELANTEAGRILLEADVQLKKDTAQLTSPQDPDGALYWEALYAKAGELFGQGNISIPTVVRPWIVPDDIIIRTGQTNAYIYKASLKVMLEQDYLPGSAQYSFSDPRLKELNEYAAVLMRERIIPKLNKEVNSSLRYAALRQLYYSLIMAHWFKDTFRGQSGVYARRIDSGDPQGLASSVSWDKTQYYEQYRRSFEQGEYNLDIRVNQGGQEMIRHYTSGGITFEKFPNMDMKSSALTSSPILNDYNLPFTFTPDGKINFPYSNGEAPSAGLSADTTSPASPSSSEYSSPYMQEIVSDIMSQLGNLRLSRQEIETGLKNMSAHQFGISYGFDLEKMGVRLDIGEKQLKQLNALFRETFQRGDKKLVVYEVGLGRDGLEETKRLVNALGSSLRQVVADAQERRDWNIELICVDLDSSAVQKAREEFAGFKRDFTNLTGADISLKAVQSDVFDRRSLALDMERDYGPVLLPQADYVFARYVAHTNNVAAAREFKYADLKENLGDILPSFLMVKNLLLSFAGSGTQLVLEPAIEGKNEFQMPGLSRVFSGVYKVVDLNSIEKCTLDDLMLSMDPSGRPQASSALGFMRKAVITGLAGVFLALAGISPSHGLQLLAAEKADGRPVAAFKVETEKSLEEVSQELGKKLGFDVSESLSREIQQKLREDNPWLKEIAIQPGLELSGEAAESRFYQEQIIADSKVLHKETVKWEGGSADVYYIFSDLLEAKAWSDSHNIFINMKKIRADLNSMAWKRGESREKLLQMLTEDTQHHELLHVKNIPQPAQKEAALNALLKKYAVDEDIFWVKKELEAYLWMIAYGQLSKNWLLAVHGYAYDEDPKWVIYAKAGKIISSLLLGPKGYKNPSGPNEKEFLFSTGRKAIERMSERDIQNLAGKIREQYFDKPVFDLAPIPAAVLEYKGEASSSGLSADTTSQAASPSFNEIAQEPEGASSALSFAKKTVVTGLAALLLSFAGMDTASALEYLFFPGAGGSLQRGIKITESGGWKKIADDVAKESGWELSDAQKAAFIEKLKQENPWLLGIEDLSPGVELAGSQALESLELDYILSNNKLLHKDTISWTGGSGTIYYLQSGQTDQGDFEGRAFPPLKAIVLDVSQFGRIIDFIAKDSKDSRKVILEKYLQSTAYHEAWHIADPKSTPSQEAALKELLDKYNIPEEIRFAVKRELGAYLYQLLKGDYRKKLLEALSIMAMDVMPADKMHYTYVGKIIAGEFIGFSPGVLGIPSFIQAQLNANIAPKSDRWVKNKADSAVNKYFIVPEIKIPEVQKNVTDAFALEWESKRGFPLAGLSGSEQALQASSALSLEEELTAGKKGQPLFWENTIGISLDEVIKGMDRMREISRGLPGEDDPFLGALVQDLNKLFDISTQGALLEKIRESGLSREQSYGTLFFLTGMRVLDALEGDTDNISTMLSEKQRAAILSLLPPELAQSLGEKLGSRILASMHDSNAGSLEEEGRQERFYKINRGRVVVANEKSPDMSAGPDDIILQRNRITGRIEVVDFGEALANKQRNAPEAFTRDIENAKAMVETAARYAASSSALTVKAELEGFAGKKAYSFVWQNAASIKQAADWIIEFTRSLPVEFKHAKNLRYVIGEIFCNAYDAIVSYYDIDLAISRPADFSEGRIEINTRIEGENLVVEVSDNGAGDLSAKPWQKRSKNDKYRLIRSEQEAIEKIRPYFGQEKSGLEDARREVGKAGGTLEETFIMGNSRVIITLPLASLQADRASSTLYLYPSQVYASFNMRRIIDDVMNSIGGLSLSRSQVEEALPRMLTQKYPYAIGFAGSVDKKQLEDLKGLFLKEAEKQGDGRVTILEIGLGIEGQLESVGLIKAMGEAGLNARLVCVDINPDMITLTQRDISSLVSDYNATYGKTLQVDFVQADMLDKYDFQERIQEALGVTQMPKAMFIISRYTAYANHLAQKGSIAIDKMQENLHEILPVFLMLKNIGETAAMENAYLVLEPGINGEANIKMEGLQTVYNGIFKLDPAQIGRATLEGLLLQNSPVSSAAEDKGGIDLSRLKPKMISGKDMDWLSGTESIVLQGEFRELEEVLASGIVPSAERMRELAKGSGREGAAQLVSIIAMILRLEEEQAQVSSQEIKDLLKELEET